MMQVADRGGNGRTRKYVLSGYYGFKNSGDEAVLKSILTALEQEALSRGESVEPIVLSSDPEWTKKQYGVDAVHRMKPGEIWSALRKSDGLISGGGSLLQDATGLGSIPYYLGIMEIARWCGKPTFVYAQGIGPVHRSVYRWPISRAFRKAKYVSVRDEESAELLRRFGVPGAGIAVVPDPVMGLPLAESAEATGESAKEARSADAAPIVGVSVRFWREDRSDLDRIAGALNELAKLRSVRIRFLPFHRGADDDASKYVMERLSGSAPAELSPAYEDPQRMLQEVSRCDLLFGMRLHSLIYAANQSVPLLGLSYDPKIDQFLRRLGQEAVGSTEALDPARFAEQAAKLLDDPELWRHEAGEAIGRLKREAVEPAQRILAYTR